MNIHWIYRIENIFTVQDFWATCACLEKQSFPWNFHCIEYISYHSSFLSNSALTMKYRVCPEIFTVFNILFTFRNFEQLALALNSLYWIYIFLVTCVGVGDWGGTVSFKAKFASVWIEWSSITSPLNWLLAEWLLPMLSIPCHNLLHTHRYNSDSRFEKSNI